MNRTTRILAAVFVTAVVAAPGCSKDPVSFTETTSGKLATPARDDRQNDERDRSGAAVTPTHQSNQPADLALVQNLRRAVVADDTLSASAKNVGIVTSGGVVVLRGAVQTAREREAIVSKATAFAGPERVVSVLEVKNP